MSQQMEFLHMRAQSMVRPVMGGGFGVPVVLMIFNRPKHTRAVFDQIAAIRPRELFVIADGPRPDRPDDAAKCRDSRAVLDRVNWHCELHTNFSDSNLGCRRRVSSGLDWVFDQVERAIILEDDCVPDSSFFPFCAELLERYEDDRRIRTIWGNSFLSGMTRTNWSYYFSNFHGTCGWATWRRSWQRVDMAMRQWPQVRDEGWLVDIVGDRRSARFWASRFDATYEGRINSWAYPYLFSCWLDHCLGVAPNRNLVQNIGFGQEATHTRDGRRYIEYPAQPMLFPLIHPPFIVCDRLSDRETFRRRCLPENGPLLKRMLRPLYHALRGTANRRAVRLGKAQLIEPREQSAERFKATVPS
jgi:hypothetical protein